MGVIAIERIVLGMLHNNVYFVSDGEHAVLVDPSCKARQIIAWLNGRKVDAIVLTHFHFDHIGAAKELRDYTGAPVYASAEDAPYIIDGENAPMALPSRGASCPVDVCVTDGDIVRFGEMEWQVMLTPGHSPGSMCWYLACAPGASVQPSEDIRSRLASGLSAFPGVLIAGDTLFEAGCGRTDFELGDSSDMEKSLCRLAGLPDDTLVLPGHGNATTIVAERAYALR